MGRFTGVMLAADYDDTLYNHSCTISQENRQAIARFLQEGGLFTISTGRSYVNFAIQMRQENLPVNVPVVLANGAAIYDFSAGKMLWQKELPDTAPAHIAQLCQHFPEVGFEAYHQDDVYVYRSNLITRRHLERCQLTGIPLPIEEMPYPWLKVILQHENAPYLQTVQAFLLEHWGDLYEATFSNPYLLEITAKGANKGNAVQRLADHFGIRPENLYCVGNGINDLPMLAVSAIPFAPENSYQEVKDWGAELLPSCDDHCIAQLIHRLEERYPE